MKIIQVCLQIICLISGCSTQSQKKYPVIDKTKSDSLGIKLVISSNCTRQSTFFVKSDSIFILTPTFFKKDSNYVLSGFTENFKGGGLKSIELKMLKSNVISELILKNHNSHLYIKEAGNPGIKYQALSNEIKEKLNCKKVKVSADTKCQLFDGKYYLLDKIYVKQLTMYDPITDIVQIFDLPESDIFEITDFVLYDINRDGLPEIFIFHIGHISRDNAISYDIYTITKK